MDIQLSTTSYIRSNLVKFGASSFTYDLIVPLMQRRAQHSCHIIHCQTLNKERAMIVGRGFAYAETRNEDGHRLPDQTSQM